MSDNRTSSDEGARRARSPSPDLYGSHDVFDDQYAASMHSDPHPSQRSPSRSTSNSSRTSGTRNIGQQGLSTNLHLPEIIPSEALTVPDTPSSPLSSNHDRERTSISKTSPDENPFNDSHEDSSRASNSNVVASDATPTPPHRPLSTVSSTSYARTQSPVHEHSGPSHPYGMYPQDLGMSRSASVTTSSTARGPSQYATHRNGPAHPYALYPQGVSNGDEEEENLQAAIPLGFPGHPATFHRRIGPEGEEQDIVGPDGHTEQLPPYSRYPVEPPKVQTAATALPVIGEGPQPEPPMTSTTPITSYSEAQTSQQQQSPLSAGGQRPLVGSTPQGPEADESIRGSSSSGSGAGSAEKSWNEKTWREKRKTRVLGMPLWLMIVLLVAALAVATIVGAVIGGVVGTADAKKKDDSSPVGADDDQNSPIFKTVTTTLIDATAVETAMPPPPAGQFYLDVGGADNSQDTCLLPPQTNAWDCRLTTPVLSVQITSDDGDSDDCPTLSLTNVNMTNPLKYGAQVPIISSQNLTKVKELHNETNGPAYHFQTTYDKLVVIHELLLVADPPDNATMKRSLPPMPGPFASFLQKGVVQAGSDVREEDRPWFCYFNQTFIEGFIFMYKDTESPPSYDTYISSTSSNPVPTDYVAPAPATPGPPGLSGEPYPATTLSSSFPSSSTPGPDSDYNEQLIQNGDLADPESEDLQARAPTRTYYVPPSRRNPTSTGYPKLFKIEERRVPPPPEMTNPPAPAYCKKMVFTDDGEWVPYIVPFLGVAQTVMLLETDPAPIPTDTSDGTPLPYTEGQWESGCYCRWENT